MRLANNKLRFEFTAMFSKSRGVLMMKLQLETVILEKKISSSVLILLYIPALTSKDDYWKNHTLGYMDLSWQSNVSAF